jgi:hypothetical protein
MTGPMPQATPIEAAGYAMLAEKMPPSRALEKALVSQEGLVNTYVNPRFDNFIMRVFVTPRNKF